MNLAINPAFGRKQTNWGKEFPKNLPQGSIVSGTIDDKGFSGQVRLPQDVILAYQNGSLERASSNKFIKSYQSDKTVIKRGKDITTVSKNKKGNVNINTRDTFGTNVFSKTVKDGKVTTTEYDSYGREARKTTVLPDGSVKVTELK